MVTEIIHQIGVPAHIKGYHYLREAIILSVKNSEIINSVTKLFVPDGRKAPRDNLLPRGKGNTPRNRGGMG